MKEMLLLSFFLRRFHSSSFDCDAVSALVMEDDSIVNLTANGTEIVKRCRVALYQVMEGKFQCTALIRNVEDGAASSFSQIKAAIVPEMKYYKQVSKHLKLVVWKDDLTTHKVDAVVNAANEQLFHGAGLAGALSRAGGPMIQKCSNELIKKSGKVPTGEVASTQAGTLPCKMIIHAVGPCVPLNPTQTEISMAAGLLQKTVQNILKKAYSENLQSVAIPAISSGIFNFPLTLCADIMVNTVKSAVENHPKAGCLEVRLVNHDDPTVQEMVRACKQFLGSSDTLPKQNLGSSPTQSSFPNLDLGNVTLYLKKGNIENEATDVIVNTIGGDFNLSKGLVSKALMDKAGCQIQRDLNHFKEGRVEDGSVFITSGHKLKCKAVYHTICPQNESRGNYAEQVLYLVVTRCLKKACNKGYSSIAFPALGTGKLGMDKNVVSHVMTTAVEAFSKNDPRSKIEIYFVIFPKDTETLKAFERKMNFANQGLQNASASTDSKGPGFHKSLEIPEIPYIELLTPPSPEAQQEAKWWLNKTLRLCPETLEILNNNIMMHLSLEDHKKLMFFQSEFHVEIKEMFQKGHGGFIIKGGALGVGCAALAVEALLCQAQENFARNEEKDMQDVLKDFGQQIETTSGKFYQKELRTEWDSMNWKKTFANYDLDIVKVEKIENPVLKKLFDLNSKRIQAQPQRLYQRVSAQFVDLICRIGFQREFAPPKEQKYGAGIYFTNDLEKAKYFWPEHEDKYIYFIEAQVLTGKHTLGLQEMIVPPPTASDPLVRYDSVTNNGGVYIIFNGQQAYPQFIVTCRRTNKHRNSLAV